ncbi:MAG: helix-turn-helix domain-containing protein [Ardenticatenaceae bacterium]
MSRNHFMRLYKQAFHTSPMDYVIRLRIQKACELLKEPSLTVSQVALEVGFSDSNYFSRQFKRVTGRNPTSFRKEVV